MSDRNATAAALRRVIGRELISVAEARYWYKGERGSDPDSLVHLWLHFAGVPPLMLHGHGEEVSLTFEEPYAPYDMQEHGEVRVGPAQAPDMLADFTGQRLRGAALIQGYTASPSVGGVQFRFEHQDLVIASLGDEWVLARGHVPQELRPYLTVGEWLVTRVAS